MTPEPRPFTAAALQPPRDRGSQWRRIPGVMADALSLVWAASPRLMLTTTLLQFFGAASSAPSCWSGKQLLQDLIAVSEDGRSVEPPCCPPSFS